jgi:hypothetical protein
MLVDEKTTPSAIQLVQEAEKKKHQLSREELNEVVPVLTDLAEFDDEALYYLALCLSNSNFDYFDLKQASSCFLLAASKNHTAAQLAIGRMYLDGVGMRLDAKEALFWLKRITSQANLSQVAISAYLLQASAYYIIGDPECMMAALRDAAALESHYARLLLSYCHYLGIERHPDMKLSLSCLERAAATEIKDHNEIAIDVARAMLHKLDPLTNISQLIPHFMLTNYRKIDTNTVCTLNRPGHPPEGQTAMLVEITECNNIEKYFELSMSGELDIIGIACNLEFYDHQMVLHLLPLALILNYLPNIEVIANDNFPYFQLRKVSTDVIKAIE